MVNLKKVLYGNGFIAYSPKMPKNVFFEELERKSIHVPSNKRDELYDHLRRTGRIYKIEKFIHECNKAALTEPKVRTTHQFTVDNFPKNSSGNLGFFEGIRNRTGLTYIGKSLNKGAGVLNKKTWCYKSFGVDS